MSIIAAAVSKLSIDYSGKPPSTHLERQPSLDLICEYVGDRLVKVGEDLHGQLGLDAALGNQIVQRVREGTAQTVRCQPACSVSLYQVRAVPASAVELVVLEIRGHVDCDKIRWAGGRATA